MTDALAWALVHFLWQGAALAGVAWALMRLTSSASARYVIGVTTMGAMVIALGATFVSLIPSDVPAAPAWATGSPSETAFESAAPVVGDPAAATFVTPEPAPAPAAVPFVLPTTWVLSVWAVGVCLLSVRVFGGWCLTRRIARHAGSPVGDDVQHLAKRISARLGIRRVVQVVESTRVAVPMMIGWLRPVVLMPPAALAGLSPVQLEAILAHEFAHIRRHDYLVNLLQTVVETLLFFHPVVWWLSRAVRRERELCCDDLAVSVCDRVTYATALSTLAHIRQPSLALAATDGVLRDRVRRIITPSSTESAKGGWMAMLPIALVVLLAAPAAFSSDPLIITTPSITIEEPQVEDADDLVVTAEPVMPTTTVETPAPVSRPALPVVLDFFMPSVQAAAWQMSPPPASQEPAPYRVRVGDDIRLTWHNLAPIDSEMSSTYRVGADGTIELKYVGAVRVVGKTTRELQEAALMALTPKIYREGVLSVAAVVTPSAEHALTERSAVVTEARVVKPGDIVIITLPEVPTLSGEWVLQADGSLRRQGPPPTATPTGAPAPPAPPQAPATGLVFMVSGEVNAPGPQVWAEGMTVEKAIALAKGMNPRGKLGHIMRAVRDEQGNVVKRVKISALKPSTVILPDDELVITRRWWGD
jgi:beta-lactamase regulating signal transducer with metallopeptidase domain/protein involved in polysaccharide export with SLBB domain